jgi:hypothetical protein
MKKILILFVVCLGLCSFTTNGFSAEINDNKLSDQFEITVDYIQDDTLYVCTATITYNGNPHGQVDGYGLTPEAACNQAYASAMLYIAAYGG